MAIAVPGHPDFERLIEAVEVSERKAETGDKLPELLAGLADPLSVATLAEIRTEVAAGKFKHPIASSTFEALQAMWADGLMAGIRFQQMGGHHDASAT